MEIFKKIGLLKKSFKRSKNIVMEPFHSEHIPPHFFGIIRKCGVSAGSAKNPRLPKRSGGQVGRRPYDNRLAMITRFVRFFTEFTLSFVKCSE
jgi:hypothetical protein